MEWLPEGHLVFFLLDLLPQLDLRGIEAKYEEKDPRGHLGFDPRMMTALLLYGYATVYCIHPVKTLPCQGIGCGGM